MEAKSKIGPQCRDSESRNGNRMHATTSLAATSSSYRGRMKGVMAWPRWQPVIALRFPITVHAVWAIQYTDRLK